MRRTWMIVPVRPAAAGLTLAALVMSFVLLGGLAAILAISAPDPATASPSQQHELKMPNLQTAAALLMEGDSLDGRAPGSAPASALGRAPGLGYGFGSGDAGLHGMDGMGESELELQNLSASPVNFNVEFVATVVSTVFASGHIAPRGGGRFMLGDVPEIEFSNYSANFTSDGPIGGIVRTAWYGGASTTHLAMQPARDFILPLVVREVYSHSSIVFLQNTSPPGVKNQLDFELFDPDGSVRQSWTVKLEGNESLPDDLYRERVWYEMFLPQNAAGGFIGTFHVHAQQPLSVMIYGDEPLGRGAYALNARPRAAADTRQYLPLVRANYQGDSLITISNAGDTPVDVFITYKGYRRSPSGAEAVYTQELTIAPRYYANIDLGLRGRGSVPSPDLPRGSDPAGGFLGSATISAGGPIIAAAWEQSLSAGDRVDNSAAYNAFGRSDLGTVFVVPHAYATPDMFPSVILLQNPGDEDAVVSAYFLTDDGLKYSELRTITVPAGTMEMLPISTALYGHVRLLIESTEPIAALAFDALPVRDRTIQQALKLADEMHGSFPTPDAPLTATPEPTITPTSSGTRVRPTQGPTPTGSLHRLFIYMPQTVKNN